LYISAHTAGSSLTAAQPVNNIVRIAYQSLACVLGGLQSFDPAGYAEAYCTLSKEEELTSMNIHNMLAYEVGAGSVADPLGGSYYIEWLTDRMEKEMRDIIAEVDRIGGSLNALGWMRTEIEKEAAREQRELEQGKRKVVGLNDFVVPKSQEVKIRIRQDRSTKRQAATAERLAKKAGLLRGNRDQVSCRKALETLRVESGKGERHSLVPAIMNALRSDSTFAEVLGAIRMGRGYDFDPHGMVQYPFGGEA